MVFLSIGHINRDLRFGPQFSGYFMKKDGHIPRCSSPPLLLFQKKGIMDAAKLMSGAIFFVFFPKMNRFVRCLQYYSVICLSLLLCLIHGKRSLSLLYIFAKNRKKRRWALGIKTLFSFSQRTQWKRRFGTNAIVTAIYLYHFSKNASRFSDFSEKKLFTHVFAA